MKWSPVTLLPHSAKVLKQQNAGKKPMSNLAQAWLHSLLFHRLTNLAVNVQHAINQQVDQIHVFEVPYKCQYKLFESFMVTNCWEACRSCPLSHHNTNWEHEWFQRMRQLNSRIGTHFKEFPFLTAKFWNLENSYFLLLFSSSLEQWCKSHITSLGWKRLNFLSQDFSLI